MTSQSPNPGRFFGDTLWSTLRLPATMNNAGTVNKKLGLAASIDGVDFQGGNPASEGDMISVINTTVGLAVYNRASGFDCTNPVNCVGGVRYVAFGGSDPVASGTQTQLADILEINSSGFVTFYGQVDWRAPPNYAPGPLGA
jgi:hypothetical protein